MAFDETKTLLVKWSKRSNDWMIYHPTGPDGWLAHSLVGGYDSFPKFFAQLSEEIRRYNTASFILTFGKGFRIKWSQKNKDWMIEAPSEELTSLAHSFLKGFIPFPEFVKLVCKNGFDKTKLRFFVHRHPKKEKPSF